MKISKTQAMNIQSIYNNSCFEEEEQAVEKMLDTLSIKYSITLDGEDRWLNIIYFDSAMLPSKRYGDDVK
jgi:hypothetical protein